VVDANGLPLIIEVTAGQVHDSKRLESLLDTSITLRHLGRARRRPKRVGGDKGYSYPRVRAWLKDHGIQPLIPLRDDQLARCPGSPPAFDKDAYRQRSIIEQTIGWLKECRRIGTRYEKLAVNFMAMIKLAIIQRYLAKEFSDRA